MTDWREKILKEFTAGVGRITLVSDPNRLFTDPSLSEVLTTKGFDLLLFEDSVAFRFVFESKYRSRLDAGQPLDLVVLHQADSSSAQRLPFDLLARSLHLSFSLSDLFPNFSYTVLAALEPQHFDVLYEAQASFGPGVLGENATKDFVLRHVFEIAAELIKSDSDLLRTLLRRHYRLQTIPPLFVGRLVQVLTETRRFDEWPLENLFQNRSEFLTFLQERWPTFLSRFLGERPMVPANLSVPGPLNLPLEDADVRVYIDNLFLEGLLQPVDWPGSKEFGANWYAFGIRRDQGRDSAERLSGLLKILERELPTPDGTHNDWFSFAQGWAELVVLDNLIGKCIKSEENSAIDKLRGTADAGFSAWLKRRFGPLHNLPGSPPVLVHHIARHLANQRMQEARRISLIVVDGLSLDQWLVLRDQILRQSPKAEISGGCCFSLDSNNHQRLTTIYLWG